MDLLTGNQFVFTGIRSAELEEKIKNLGGVVVSAVSGNTTHLVMKELGTGSKKEQEAIKRGITIMTIEECEEMINEFLTPE